MNATGKVALISDASTGAAEAVAKRLEQDGARVLRNYPEGFPPGFSNKTDCSAFSTVGLDSVKSLSTWVLDTAGHLDWLIHTDNFIFRATVEEISEVDFANCVSRNAKSAFLCTKVLSETIAASGGGSMVYLSSLHDEKPTGAAFAYSCGRGAVKMLCREMALFLGRKGIRCNLVEMDVTEETADALDSLVIPFNYDVMTKVPLKRMTHSHDFAGTVSFLVSDDAAHVNGAEIRVDGGHLFHYIDR